MCYTNDNKLLMAASSENLLKSFEHLIFHYKCQIFFPEVEDGFLFCLLVWQQSKHHSMELLPRKLSMVKSCSKKRRHNLKTIIII